jgi:hypothetical protein
MNTPEPGRKSNVNRYGLGPYTPSENLPFPVRANFTAVEILTFLPNTLKCADVVYRLVSNGATRHVLWAIINTSRDFPEEWGANCCGTTIYKTMRGAGYEDWTVNIHGRWHAAVESTWDETNLDVSGFRTPGQRQAGTPAAVIPFKNLAVDIRKMPEGDDTLDLTRMVQYCVRNAQEQWMYPRDYWKLLSLMGGPARIRPENLDRAIFTRWQHVTPAPPRLWSEEDMEIRETLKMSNGSRKRKTRMRMSTPFSEDQSREITPMAEVPRKKRGRPRKRARMEEIAIEDVDVEDKRDDMENETPQYSRSAAEYVAAPKEVITASYEAIDLAFAAEGAVGETDPSSAYAFGGPRHQPPFRMLHDIAQPDPADISGWAENLRWAFEQRACFWHAVETEGWNESPEHMEFIAKTRQTQVWASDELLDQLPDVYGED